MIRVHKVRLDLNDRQATHMTRAAGVARFAYNWALAEWGKQYADHKADPTLPQPTEAYLRKKLNKLKRTEYPWMLEVTKCAPQEAIMALGKAFSNFFAGRAKYPRFKARGRHDAFRISQGFFAADGSRLRIPNLGWVRMREPLRFAGRLVSATISRTAGGWYAAVAVDTQDNVLRSESQAEVGVDLGVKAFAVLSTGEVIEGPKALRAMLYRLRGLSKAHSRKKLGSANRKKSSAALASLHWRISCVRADALHKLSDRLTREFGWVAIEDLNVGGMMANRRLARHVGDQGFAEFRRQLHYKSALRGVHLAVVGRFEPTSKRCSVCGELYEGLALSDRVWTCCSCGVSH
ncbi:MAG: transposase, partial [Alcaligenaceae bacterium]